MYRFLILGMLLLVAGCHMKEETIIKDDSLNYEEEISFANRKSLSAPLSLETNKIIKEGKLRFVVNHLHDSKSLLDRILKSHEGYYEKEDLYFSQYSKKYSLVIRIPNLKFDSLVSGVEQNIKDLTFKSIEAKDVSEEYIDLKIRLENDLAFLDQYKDILKKANTIEDILSVQEKILEIEGSINSKKGRQAFLDKKVNYSTLSIELNEILVEKEHKHISYLSKLKSNFLNGVDGILNLFLAIMNFWPILSMLLGVWMLRRRIVRKK